MTFAGRAFGLALYSPSSQAFFFLRVMNLKVQGRNEMALKQRKWRGQEEGVLFTTLIRRQDRFLFELSFQTEVPIPLFHHDA